jgi:hypothetical protein
MAYCSKNNNRRRTAIAATLATLSLFTLASRPSAAMESPKVFRGVLILEGKIEPGDYISLHNFLRNESNFDKITGGVFLASSGGHVREALKIGNLIRLLRLSTTAPASPPRRDVVSPPIRATDLVNPRNYECASACFLVYVAGSERQLSWAGRLGLHQPQLLHKPDSASDDDVMIVTAGIRNALRQYLNKMDVPPKYLEFMYAIPPTEVRWITQQEFDEDLKGYVPGMIALLRQKCEGSRDKASCVRQTRSDLSKDAWRTVFGRP